MKNRILHTLIVLSLLTGCNPPEKDDLLPTIDMQTDGAFPADCATIQRGSTFIFKATFRDNEELGSYSIEMHHNFDHHTHSTSSVECSMDPVKVAVHPFHYLEEFAIPDNKTEYKATVQIAVPDSVDPGDYHFMIRVTDRAGWQALKGISVRIKSEPQLN